MQCLSYALWVLFVLLWLIGWACLLAEPPLCQQRYSKQSLIEKWTQKLSKKFLPCLMLIILTGCCASTVVPIEVPVCPPMLRAATYKTMQSDERRDYRIAVERCQSLK